jgi:prepilin-type N-terminal cleavage/methylation domain-containing protein
MKNQSTRNDRGFTLVELLVVIAIIAVLASVGFAAGRAAIERARRVTSQAAASALVSAVNGFFSEYGSLPSDATSDSASLVDTSSDKELITILSGLPETSDPPKNPRAIKFLQVAEGKNKKNGMIYGQSGKSVDGLFDSWGGGYKVMMDADYDERLSVSVSGKSINLNGRRVAAWSLGADGTKGGGKALDDVTTW